MSEFNITEEEALGLIYMWKEKGDPTRLIGWEDIIKKCPLIEKAWNDFKMAEQTFDLILEGIANKARPSYEEEEEQVTAGVQKLQEKAAIRTTPRPPLADGL